jgi:hypothetical protein
LGFPTIPRKLKKSDACILRKHNKQPFHDSTSIACRKLELIHFDLCVPMPIPSANGHKYIVTFIDHYTMMYWVYLMKDKSQVFETLEKFHVWVQNEAQYCIGSLRIDNGREYKFNEFQIYLRQHGIKHQTTVPNNPQENSVDGRMNMTLLNMVRSMMFFRNVELMFWVFVALCAVYVKNKCPYHVIKKKDSI